MPTFRWCLVIVAVILLCGCEPGKAQVVEEVLRNNPHSRVVSVTVGEGDADHCYVYVPFYDSVAGARYEQVYGYERVNGVQWKVFHRDPKRLLP